LVFTLDSKDQIFFGAIVENPKTKEMALDLLDIIDDELISDGFDTNLLDG
jgi:hypothetical protein